MWRVVRWPLLLLAFLLLFRSEIGFLPFMVLIPLFWFRAKLTRPVDWDGELGLLTR